MRNRNNINERKFYSAILSLRCHQECKAFFNDILTPNECNMLIQRIEISELLLRGLTYKEISKITRASTATISRVNQSLHYGTGGLLSVLEKNT
jgi:TrpR-related protein YerC/YecD